MAERESQFWPILYIGAALDCYFQACDDVYVVGKMLLHHQEGDGKKSVSPSSRSWCPTRFCTSRCTESRCNGLATTATACPKMTTASEQLDLDHQVLAFLISQRHITLEKSMTTVSLKMSETLAIRLQDAARERGVSKSVLIEVPWRCTWNRMRLKNRDLPCPRQPTSPAYCLALKTCPQTRTTLRISASKTPGHPRHRSLGSPAQPDRPASSVDQGSMGTNHAAAPYLRSRSCRSLLSGPTL